MTCLFVYYWTVYLSVKSDSCSSSPLVLFMCLCHILSRRLPHNFLSWVWGGGRVCVCSLLNPVNQSGTWTEEGHTNTSPSVCGRPESVDVSTGRWRRHDNDHYWVFVTCVCIKPVFGYLWSVTQEVW